MSRLTPRCARWREPHRGHVPGLGTVPVPKAPATPRARRAEGRGPGKCLERVFKQPCPGVLCPRLSAVVLSQAGCVSGQGCPQRSQHHPPSGTAGAGGHECFCRMARGRIQALLPVLRLCRATPHLRALCSAPLWSLSLLPLPPNSPFPRIPRQSQSWSWGCPHPWHADRPPKSPAAPREGSPSPSPSPRQALRRTALPPAWLLLLRAGRGALPTSLSSYIKGLKFNMNFKRGTTGWSRTAGPGPGAELRHPRSRPGTAACRAQLRPAWPVGTAAWGQSKVPGHHGHPGVPRACAGLTVPWSPRVTTVHDSHGTWRLRPPGAWPCPVPLPPPSAAEQPLITHRRQAQHHPAVPVPGRHAACAVPVVPHAARLLPPDASRFFPRHRWVGACWKAALCWGWWGGGARPPVRGQLMDPGPRHVPQSPCGCAAPAAPVHAALGSGAAVAAGMSQGWENTIFRPRSRPRPCAGFAAPAARQGSPGRWAAGAAFGGCAVPTVATHPWAG